MRYFLIFLALGLMPAAAQDAGEGETLFMQFCATCHGVEGRGDGPMAPVLTLQPVDLTQLSKREGGFPDFTVIARIDGRDPLVAHGSPMPVYGPFFEGAGVAHVLPDGQRVITSQPILDLLAFIKELQE